MRKFFGLKYLLAGRFTTQKKTLERLAASHHAKLRIRVAENKRCPLQLLRKLANDKSADVRIAVALNRKVDRETLEILSRDSNPDVRIMIASTSYIPREHLQTLAEDENPYVASQARVTLMRLRCRGDNSLIRRLCSPALLLNR